MTIGTWAYQAGSSGTVTLPVGAVVTHIRAESHSSTGSIAIFGGTAITVDGASGGGQHQTFEMSFPDSHGVCKATTGAADIVFTDTASYFVGYIVPA